MNETVIGIEEFGGPQQLKEIVMERRQLAPRQLRIAIKAIGVNRADILLRSGRYHSRSLPAVPGFEASGIVIESNSRIPLGARVLVFDRGQGLYRESAVVDEQLVVQIPNSVSFEYAAALPVNWLTAAFSIQNLLRLSPGDCLLVTAAASGVGLAAIQIAKRAGLKVIAAAGSAAKLELCRATGADHVVNYLDEDIISRVSELTSGLGVQGALDIVGGAFFGPTLKTLAPFGAMVSLANVTTEDSRMNTRDFYPKNASIYGFQLGSLLASNRWNPRPLLEDLLNGVASGEYRPIIHKTFPLRNAALAHVELESRLVAGKVLLV